MFILQHVDNIHVIYCPSFPLNSQNLSNTVGYQQPLLQRACFPLNSCVASLTLAAEDKLPCR